MTSWTRGDKNEDKGERLMKKPGVANKAKGAALKAVGELEQGMDNVKDRVTGRQKTLKGTTHKPATTRTRKSTSTPSASRSKSK